MQLSRAVPVLALLMVFAVGGAASATVVQDGTLRVTLLAQIAPYKLPRQGTVPISVFVSGHVESSTGGVPPQLRRMDIMVNRHGVLQSRGLPVCPIPRIQTATTQKALHSCAGALIGSGRFWAHIVLPDQAPYPTHGRLLIFNGQKGGRPAVLAHIFTSNPFPSSFVIAFALRHIQTGSYATELTATLPQALGEWGYVDRIKLNLKRKYRYKGEELSYFNAGCPVPKATDRAPFPLATARFYFDEHRVLPATVVKACGTGG